MAEWKAGCGVRGCRVDLDLDIPDGYWWETTHEAGRSHTIRVRPTSLEMDFARAAARRRAQAVGRPEPGRAGGDYRVVRALKWVAQILGVWSGAGFALADNVDPEFINMALGVGIWAVIVTVLAIAAEWIER